MHEDAIIELASRLQYPHPNITYGIGDDAAVLAPQTHPWLWSSDMLTENVHFTRQLPPSAVGWKSLAVNLSDLAAMGGQAQAFTLSLGLPPDLSPDWIEAYFEGLHQCATYHQVNLVGGDTVKASQIVISISILGQSPRPLYRHGSQLGDLIVATGTHGSSAAGLYCLQNGLVEQWPTLVEAHLRPQPRLDAGLTFNQAHSRACLLDSSDGLARSLQLLCQDPQLGCQIDLENIPVDSQLYELAHNQRQSANHWILHGGEDYQLIGTIPAAERALLPPSFYVLGKITPGPALLINNSSQQWNLRDQPAGFQHFT